MVVRSVWPAEWRVFLYWGGGLPREATKIGRRIMLGSDALEGFGMIWVSGGGEDKAFGLLLDFVISFQRGMNISRQLF